MAGACTTALAQLGCPNLVGVDFGGAADPLLLERKDDMRNRGLASPDFGDPLALTFAYPVLKRDWGEERRIEEKLNRMRQRFL